MKGLIKDIIIAAVIVIAVTTLIKPTLVKESSMEPTLYENNYLLVSKQAYRFGEEKRGDIIVFQSHINKDDGNGKKLLIKRIIGISGDVITIKNNKVYINGNLTDEAYTLEGITPGEVSNLTVPEGELFVMGDNRSVSIDSRSEEVGCVNKDDVMGKAIVRLYPFDKITRL
ncbi:MAG: signal peptidase I [Anaerovoracaceae bacterium]